MIIKKLAVPLINDKTLPQAEHCYIATAAISEQAFDFIKSRLPTECKIEIVTGLHALTSPGVLRRIWRHYQDRITLKIYTKNFFHANVYIFDLPYRKSVAFLGSGHFTLDGIKDGEEIFYRITDVKEIEALKSWFTGYYEFSEPLTEAIVQEYELIYPAMRQREIISREEKDQVMALTTRGFNWDTIRFKNQYFKKEDYVVLGNQQASLNTPEVHAARVIVVNKLLGLHALIEKSMGNAGLYLIPDVNGSVTSPDPADHPDQKITSMSILYGRSEAELKRYGSHVKPADLMNLQIVVRQTETGIRLMIGKPKGSRDDREYFRKQMEGVEYRSIFFKLIQDLGEGYWIEVAGEKKAVNTFPTEDVLWEFTKSDDWRHYTFVTGRNYRPGDPEISTENIAATVLKELEKLIPVYKHVKDKSL